MAQSFSKNGLNEDDPESFHQVSGHPEHEQRRAKAESELGAQRLAEQRELDAQMTKPGLSSWFNPATGKVEVK